MRQLMRQHEEQSRLGVLSRAAPARLHSPRAQHDDVASSCTHELVGGDHLQVPSAALQAGRQAGGPSQLSMGERGSRDRPWRQVIASRCGACTRRRVGSEVGQLTKACLPKPVSVIIAPVAATAREMPSCTPSRCSSLSAATASGHHLTTTLPASGMGMALPAGHCSRTHSIRVSARVGRQLRMAQAHLLLEMPCHLRIHVLSEPVASDGHLLHQPGRHPARCKRPPPPTLSTEGHCLLACHAHCRRPDPGCQGRLEQPRRLPHRVLLAERRQRQACGSGSGGKHEAVGCTRECTRRKTIRSVTQCLSTQHTRNRVMDRIALHRRRRGSEPDVHDARNTFGVINTVPQCTEIRMNGRAVLKTPRKGNEVSSCWALLRQRCTPNRTY